MTHRIGDFRQNRSARLLGGDILDRAGGGARRIVSIDHHRCGRRRNATLIRPDHQRQSQHDDHECQSKDRVTRR